MDKSSVSRWDWLSAALLFLLIQVAAARLVTTDWAPFLYFAETLAALGTVIGLALGASQYKRRIVLWFVIDYTLALLPWQMTSALNKGIPFTDRFLNIGSVLLTALNQFLQRKPVQDSLFFVAFASLGFWLLALAAGYWLIRHRNLPAAILPAGIAMLVIQAYDNFQPHTSWWIAVYILLALLLLGRQYYLNNQKEWEKRRVFINDEAWTNIFSGLFATAALSVIVAWTIPTSLQNLQATTDAWSQFTKPLRDRLSNAVTSLDTRYGSGGTNFYGDRLGLGLNAEVGDTQVFSVDVLSSSAVPRYYWRGHIYDFYNNGQWLSTPASKLDFDPDSGNLNIPNEDNRSVALLEFTFQLPTQSLIYAPSQPVWVDRSSIVSATQVDLGVEDVLAWEARPPIQTGSQYQVRAKIAGPSVDQLRAASNEYPQWIKDRYLEIPEAIQPDFQSLAEKITAGQETPYDKATVITAYLRANLQYEINLPAAPEGQDPLAWVLFTYKKGFCNYYASAEVML
ncbi:MAG TPA: transglutaminase-like domain-containing protein, partial [Anaerolineales bacterium]|nr:transglutaminase-like domain-containing protein [Anaerolineales bacterium]